ncbi:MAG: hypothetical protein HYX41_03530 [Bdellovibrio sp.]|nr:hypothetical protein [Bdellovibrio sp.]
MTKIVFLLVGILISANALAVGGGYRERRVGRVLFELKKNLSEAQQREVFQVWYDHGLGQEKAQTYSYEAVDSRRGRVSEEELAAKLMATGAVEFAEPDYLVPHARSFSDPYLRNEWHLGTINASRAWDISVGNSNVVVTVCSCLLEIPDRIFRAYLLTHRF